MLKILPNFQLNPQIKTKCGEIFCSSHKDFTINCCFCNIKLFSLDEFLLHLGNLHFENNSLKITEESKQYPVKNASIERKSDELCYTSDDEKNSDSSGEDHGCIKVLKMKNKKATKVANQKNLNDHIAEQGQKEKSKHNKQIVENISATKTRNLAKYQQYLCPECKESFPHKLQLDRHVFEFHNGYKCTMCDKRFRLQHHLKRHVHTHTAERKFPCPMAECSRIFTDEEYLKRHLEMHTMERTFVCDFENCGKAFQTQRRLMTHNYTHRKPKKFVCDTCGYSCRAFVTLSIHQRVHTGEKPFACDVCAKKFVSKTALVEHMITHSSTRPHVCQICNAAFANQRILQRHAFIHSEEKTFKCKFCDKAFKQANGLDGHMRRLHREPNITTS